MSSESKTTNEFYKRLQKSLIAALLFDSSNFNKVLETVDLEDFSEPNLATIFEAMLMADRRGDKVTAVTVAECLEEGGNLNKVGGNKELYMLRSEGEKRLIEAPVFLYARMVKEASSKNKMSEIIEEHSKIFKLDSGISARDGISELQSNLNTELYKISKESNSFQFSESLKDFYETLKRRKEITETNKDSGGLQGIPSLLPTLNKYTTGWLPGQMITVGARTGVGKSIFAINCAVAAAQAGKSVQFFSLEMSEDEIQNRFIASITSVTLNDLKTGVLNDFQLKLLKDSEELISKMKIKVDTEPKLTIDNIRAKALQQAQSEEGLDLIIIDYLQLISPSARFNSRQEAVADISRNVKLLAKQLEIPIIVLVQLNRENKKDKDDGSDTTPKLDDIRESAAIGQDSDIVILLHRNRSLDDTIPHTLVILDKNRNGEAQKTIRCHSNLASSMFREIIKAKDIEQRATEEDEQKAADDFDFEALDEFDDDLDMGEEDMF